jgi:hypothetical protein
MQHHVSASRHAFSRHANNQLTGLHAQLLQHKGASSQLATPS